MFVYSLCFPIALFLNSRQYARHFIPSCCNGLVSVLPSGTRSSLYVDDLIISASLAPPYLLYIDLHSFYIMLHATSLFKQGSLTLTDSLPYILRFRLQPPLIFSTLDYGCHIYYSASASLLAHLYAVYPSGAIDVSTIFLFKLSVPQSLLPMFTSSPCLPTPFSIRLDAPLTLPSSHIPPFFCPFIPSLAYTFLWYL